ncbi:MULTISPECIES: PhzF family phenazine biosynthesis isomerase [Streptomyces]|uniref:PhzF family phenazine biosynthesis isomerase n=1 Tax=Streptomyces TaxID=1883 RepID=UPI001E3317E4|nr:MULTISPECIES: PhzF family phenazine biosynthesis isomerase [Streptomyces]UFQ19123.1 PhzF family phenazine biosynthesis isomerase [Streptomyces huasconensis]WCL88742.1 PhzF family phenazine biosynthesis isomerase [Streptomyces sp. JCM 35825]
MRRDGRGGSPTAVTDDDPAATDADRRAVAAAAGTSHAAFLGPGRTPDGGLPVRFFTATAELSGCGHGTVAAQAVRLARTALGELTGRQHSGGRTFDTLAIRRPAGIEVWFDQGLVVLRHPAPSERAAIGAALGLTADDPHPADAPCVAAPGAPRMLVPVRDRSALFRVRPHFGRLTAACRRYGLLGCFVYVPPVGDRPGAARMFAPAIGVDEDVANANSTGCLAAHLLDTTGAQTIAIGADDRDRSGAGRRPRPTIRRARVGPARADGHRDPGRRVGCGPRLSRRAGGLRRQQEAYTLLATFNL